MERNGSLASIGCCTGPHNRSGNTFAGRDASEKGHRKNDSGSTLRDRSMQRRSGVDTVIKGGVMFVNDGEWIGPDKSSFVEMIDKLSKTDPETRRN